MRKIAYFDKKAQILSFAKSLIFSELKFNLNYFLKFFLN
jgi:hypothetical protein